MHVFSDCAYVHACVCVCACRWSGCDVAFSLNRIKPHLNSVLMQTSVNNNLIGPDQTQFSKNVSALL